MARYKYLVFGVLWCLAGSVMLTTELVFDVRVFGIRLGSLWLPLWPPSLLLGGMYLWYHAWVQKNLKLTREEIERYLDKLEAAMPTILHMLEKGRSVREVAVRLEEEYGIPKVVTLKFIIEMGEQWKSGG